MVTTLLSLPTEVLITILVASPSTRTLLRLASVNRRMRSIWQEHSQHIVISVYQLKIPHIEQAIALTNIEVHNGENFRLQNASKVHLCLPRVLRNAGIATAILDAAAHSTMLRSTSWENDDSSNEIVRAYYLLRWTLLAYDHPELRPSIHSALCGLTARQYRGNYWIFRFMLSRAPENIRASLRIFEPNPDAWDGTYRDPEMNWYKLTDRWRAVEIVFLDAEAYHLCGEQQPLSFDPLAWEHDDSDTDSLEACDLWKGE